MKTPLYPLSFEPLFQYRMWGGNKLQKELGKKINEENIGESWELSAVSKAETEVAQGPLKGQKLSTLISEYKGQLVGQKIWEQYGKEFPLLIKFIDARLPLSVQVHPNDAWAREKHNSFGKNEMWFIMQADPGAELILGFENALSPETFESALEAGTLDSFLHKEPVSAGDAFYIPTGLVHAIGGGILLVEIQQTSDITYRMYDFNRVDSLTGSPRELHTDMALSVADFNKKESAKTYSKEINQPNTLINSPYFSTNYFSLQGELNRDYQTMDSFVILIGLEGQCSLTFQKTTYPLEKGTVILLPAAIGSVSLVAMDAQLLEVFMP